MCQAWQDVSGGGGCALVRRRRQQKKVVDASLREPPECINSFGTVGVVFKFKLRISKALVCALMLW